MALPTNTAPSFEIGNGKVKTAIGLSADEAYSVTIQPDGKILVAGYVGSVNGNYDFALVRFNTDGSLDTSFDGDGKVTTAIGSSFESGYSVAIQADGKILVAGTGWNVGNYDIALVRYNKDGSLDITFDSDGKIFTPIGDGYDYGRSVTVQSDGKILVAGYAQNGGKEYFALVRYNIDGSLDTTFDGDGKVTTAINVNAYSAQGRSVTLQPDGKILLAGYSFDGSSGDNDFALVRYNIDGSLDTSFDGDGKVTTAVGTAKDYAQSVALQPDGKILVAGYAYIGSSSLSSSNFALVRYNINGTLDTSFDGDGKVTTAVGFSNNKGESVAVQSDGKVLVAGYSYNGSRGAITLVRYNTDGSLDTTFDGDGKVFTEVGSTSDYGYSVIVQPDGKILVAGIAYSSSSSYFALVRYNTDGTLDTRFGTINSLNAVPTVYEQGAYLLDSTVQIYDAELYLKGNYAGASITLTRHGGASVEDQFSITSNFSPLTEGSLLIIDGSTAIGVVNYNSRGTLTITFNINATQSVVNSVLSSLCYCNTSDNPPASVLIDWIFSDGFTGVGGAAATSKSMMVNITPINDAPNGTNNQITLRANTGYTLSAASFGFSDAEDGTALAGVRINTLPTSGKLYYMGVLLTVTGVTFTSDDLINGYLTYQPSAANSSFTFSVKDSGGLFDTTPNTLAFRINSTPTGSVTINGSLTETARLTAVNNLGDADGMGTITYTWYASGSTTSIGTGSTYTLTRAEVGKNISVTASFIDGYGTLESKTFLATDAVAPAITGSEGADNIMGTNGDDVLVGLGGNDSIVGGAGTDTAIFMGKGGNYGLTYDAGFWRTEDKVGNQGIDTLSNVEKLQFADRTVIIASQSHGSYTDLPVGLYQFFITAFNAAPGVTYMDQLAAAYRAGMSIKQIVDVFTTKSQFTDVYPTSLSHGQLAQALVNNIVKTSASDVTKQQAVKDITAAMDQAGWTVGQVIYQVFGNLANFSYSDATWGNTAKQFANEIAVAKTYTDTLSQSTTDLATLRSVMAPVSHLSDVSTPDLQITLIGQALMA